MFGVIIPNQACLTNFNQVDATKWVISLTNELPTNEIVVFKLPNTTPIPQNAGIGIYLSDSSMSSWEFFDVLFNEKPSSLFLVPPRFGTDSTRKIIGSGQIFTNIIKSNDDKNTLYLGLSLEPRAMLESLKPNWRGHMTSMNENIATFIAKDLYQFVESFVKPMKIQNNSTIEEVLVLPMNFLEKWMKKMMEKIQSPFFWKQ